MYIALNVIAQNQNWTDMQKRDELIPKLTGKAAQAQQILGRECFPELSEERIQSQLFKVFVKELQNTELQAILKFTPVATLDAALQIISTSNMIDVQHPTKRATLRGTENKEDVAQLSLTANTGKETLAQMMFSTNSGAPQQVSHPSWQSKWQKQRKTEEGNTTSRIPYQAYQKNRFNASKPRGRGRPRGSFNKRGYGQAGRRYGCFGCGETTHGIKFCPNSNQQGQQRQRYTSKSARLQQFLQDCCNLV